MGAMEINKTGTTARDGLSGGVDGANAISVGIVVRRLSSSPWFTTEQTLDLRQGRQNALLRPCLDLFGRKLQQGGKVFVAGHAEPCAQRAFTHAEIYSCRDDLARNLVRLPEDHWLFAHHLRTEASRLPFNCAGEPCARALTAPTSGDLPQVLGTGSTRVGKRDAATHIGDVGE